MAVNYGLLEPVDIAGQFMAGRQQTQANELAKQQNEMRQQEFGMRQQEFATQAEDRKLKLDRANERNVFLTQLSDQMKQGGYTLNRETLGSMMNFGLKSNEESLVNLATKGLQALDEQDQFQSEMGRIAPKPAAVPIQPGALGSGTFGMVPEPTNALAAAPVVAPSTNAMVGGYTRSQVEQMLSSPNARMSSMGKNLLAALPKAAAAPAVSDISRLIAERNALQPGDSNIATYDAAIRKASTFAPPASTTVNVSTEKAYGSGVAAGAAKEDLETINRSRAIPQEFAKIDETLDVLKNTDINTGLGADLFTVLDKARVQVAADKKAGVRSVNTEYLDSLLGSAVFPQIQALGIGARGMDTPAEREFLRKVMTGSVGLNKDTLIKMTELRRKGLENEATQFNKRVQSGEFKPYEEAARRKVNAVEVPQIQPSGASKIPGQGQTPAAPAAARTVTRTGTLNGRRVIQYSDGSTEYGN
jgi:hypothetical protein